MATIQITESFQNLLVTSVAVTDADHEIMTNNPEVLVNMVITGIDNGSLSFGVADIEHFYLGNEGVNGGAYVQDLMVDLGDEAVDGFRDEYFGADIVATVTPPTTSCSWVTGGADYALNWQPAASSLDIGILCEIVHTVVISEGQILNAELRLYNDDGTSVVTYDNFGTLGAGTHVLVAYGYLRRVNFSYIFEGVADSASAGNYTDTASIKALTALEIANYIEECRTTYLNKQIGTSNLALIRDASGRPTAPVDNNTLAFNASGENVDTEFKPNLGAYTIEESVVGLLADLDVNGDPLGTFSQRAEFRTLTFYDDGA